jgi:propionyl-CoA carboxylase beta chain
VIMPHSSRRRIARAFASLRNKQVETRWRKHDTIPL